MTQQAPATSSAMQLRGIEVEAPNKMSASAKFAKVARMTTSLLNLRTMAAFAKPPPIAPKPKVPNIMP
ncbi:hypothetical protein GCM10010987_44680 [Bradyrhizobium guangdongense]|uniref:Uncharacterized protein n=1 Tax=Bradyrhizobium guangdongense TaxID=1325090 RepID=A0AA87W656_9BRAD|nr:hypothetical protein GCM10010987_44680 [Bradyrhizobium guangdongense]